MAFCAGIAMAGATTAWLAAPDQLDALISACPFDPNDIKPQAFDFAPHLVEKAKPTHREKKGKTGEAGRTDTALPASEGQEQNIRLPHRLKLSAFSRSVGHRPMGLQVAQVKMFAQRFPSDFREMAMQKVVLPCNTAGTLPYVAKDGLPCPALSTMNALRWLEQHPQQWKTSEAAAQIQRVLTRGLQVLWSQVPKHERQAHKHEQIPNMSTAQNMSPCPAAGPRGFNCVCLCVLFLFGGLIFGGLLSGSPGTIIQVEWVECESFLQWQLHVETSSVQASVQVMPHVLDTAMKYLTFCRSPAASAADATEGRGVDELFGTYLQGKSVHRLKEAKTLLHACEPNVLASLAVWRKGVHFLHANALAQTYFISCEEWTALLGRTVSLEKSAFSLQEVVAKQVMQIIGEAEILSGGEVPKLKKSNMTLFVFKELCNTALLAAKYKSHLQNKFAGVWSGVASGDKLFKRLIVSGETGLRSVFSRGLSLACDKIEKLDFVETDPTCDFAQIIGRMESAMATLREEERKKTEAAAAAKAEAAQAATAARDAAPDGGGAAPDWPAAAETTADSQEEEDSAKFWAELTAEQPRAPSPGQEQQIKQEAAPLAEEPPSAEDRAMQEMRQKAYVAIDDVFVLYDRPWSAGEPAPKSLEVMAPGTMAKIQVRGKRIFSEGAQAIVSSGCHQLW